MLASTGTILILMLVLLLVGGIARVPLMQSGALERGA